MKQISLERFTWETVGIFDAGKDYTVRVRWWHVDFENKCKITVLKKKRPIASILDYCYGVNDMQRVAEKNLFKYYLEVLDALTT